MDQKNLRLFVGIDLPLEIKRQIHELQDELKPFLKGGGWKREDQFHLTVKFLGDVQGSRLESVYMGITSGIKRFEIEGGGPFDIAIDHLGYFGEGSLRGDGSRNVKVIWIGPSNESMPMLDSLFKASEDGFAESGFKRDFRPYAPHITLVQDTRILDGFIESYWNERARALLSTQLIRVETVTLFLSEKRGDKRVYVRLAKIPIIR